MNDITLDDVMKELRFSHAFLNKVWPYLRHLVKRKLTRRCVKCTLSEKYVEIKDGLCSICRSDSPMKVFEEIENIDYQRSGKELNELLESIQGKGKRSFDVLFYYSGGKDSTFLLNKLKQDFPGMRILAFTVDNGFRSPYAEKNVKIFCKSRQIEHMELGCYSLYRKLYKYGFENFSYKGFQATDICQGELSQDLGRNIAAQLEIPYLVLGYTPEQVATIPKEFNANQFNIHQFVYKESQHFKRETFLDTRLDSIFTPGEMKYWWNADNWDASRIPVMILPFLGWGYNKSEVLEAFSDFEGLTQRDPMLTNDLYWILGFYLDYKIRGYGSMEAEWATYVRGKRADRIHNRNNWEAYEYNNTYHESIHLKSLGMQWVLHKLGIKTEELDGIIARNIDKLQSLHG